MIIHFFTTIGLDLDHIKVESLGILVPFAGRLVPTLGGIILFGNDSARLCRCPDARISCARFRGTSKAEFLDSLDIEGTVLDAVPEVLRFIRRNTRTAAKIEGLYRLEIPEYPDVAVREALVNAVAHSAYFLSGMRIMVAIYDDRLEIQNPGMLPFGMTLDDLKAGVSKSRNRMIARVMRTLAMMEEWGSGYKRIMEACSASGYPEPEWQEFGSAIRVVFKPHSDVFHAVAPHIPAGVPANVPVNERQAWFLDQLAAGQKSKPLELANHWRVNKKTAMRDIAYLKNQGLIEFVGAPKTGFYRLLP